MSVLFIPLSRNAKTGPMPSSIVERASGRPGGAFFGQGDCAETGALAVHRARDAQGLAGDLDRPERDAHSLFRFLEREGTRAMLDFAEFRERLGATTAPPELLGEAMVAMAVFPDKQRGESGKRGACVVDPAAEKGHRSLWASASATWRNTLRPRCCSGWRREVAGYSVRLRRRALRPACAMALLCALAPPAGADAGKAGSSPPSNGGFLGSRLISPRSTVSCPPDIGPMYRADAIVTGTDMRQRPWGFARTLREVLVKASGDPRLADDPRTGRLAAHAARFVACFTYVDLMADVPLHDDQGTFDRPHRLTVTFDPAKIDAILAQFGERPWRGKRPVVVPVLRVDGPKPPPYLLSAEVPAGEEQRGSFATAALRFGMQARIPGGAELRGWGATAGHFPSNPPPSSAAAAVVLGTLEWSETLPGWIGNWRMRWHGKAYAWGISGVNYDAAFRNIVRGVMLVFSGAGAPDRGN
jgi:uncharacterized protein